MRFIKGVTFIRMIKIGIIGLDTSHVIEFTKLLNNPNGLNHVPGGRVVVAYPGGSENFAISKSRVAKFTEQMKNDFGIKIVSTIKELAEQCDAIMLESVDGAAHLEQLREIVSFRKPIFIDKPFSVSTETAEEMIQLAKTHKTSLMSSSALRYAEKLKGSLAKTDKGRIIGADCFGPMELIDEGSGYFWYGIHLAEMLFAILGPGVHSVTTIAEKKHDVIIGAWTDGKIGTARGIREGNPRFGALIHFESGKEYFEVDSAQKPFYAGLVEEIIEFFTTGCSKVPIDVTKEIIRFVEAANESAVAKKTIKVGP
ncbi:Gfo/Idh/MocA family protein [Sporosarcina jiandibaonis]|uniref:Gfo/Idh/MocA family protein n=1 Tax=Sporosarcina jiandibaonis TaxID=2715535 RepID=UPI0015579107|nr:Gfo/Idh/MocA family oxidoreductase [Sporosarcina jiandibaonis]